MVNHKTFLQAALFYLVDSFAHLPQPSTYRYVRLISFAQLQHPARSHAGNVSRTDASVRLQGNGTNVILSKVGLSRSLFWFVQFQGIQMCVAKDNSVDTIFKTEKRHATRPVTASKHRQSGKRIRRHGQRTIARIRFIGERFPLDWPDETLKIDICFRWRLGKLWSWIDYAVRPKNGLKRQKPTVLGADKLISDT